MILGSKSACDKNILGPFGADVSISITYCNALLPRSTYQIISISRIDSINTYMPSVECSEPAPGPNGRKNAILRGVSVISFAEQYKKYLIIH